MRSFPRFFLSLAFALAFLLPVPRAQALTTPQIQAILSVLTSFGVDASTVENVRAILEGKPNPKLPLSGNASDYPYLVVLSPGSGTHVPLGGSLAISWQGLSANSVYLLTLAPVDNPLSVLTSISVRAYDAGCSANLSCSYTWTPSVTGTSTVFAIREQFSGKTNTVSPIVFGNP